jgi:hypothetical protein
MGARERLRAFKENTGMYSGAPPKPEPRWTPRPRPQRALSSERDALRSAVRRCHNPRTNNYQNYGGRGITVCEAWREPKRGFERFLAHIGPKPTRHHSLDRIDNNGHYEPGNVRWADKQTQTSNRRPWGTNRKPAA